MEPYDIYPPVGEGFTYSNGNKKWVLKILNNGDRPATNVSVKYEISMYKNQITFGIDRADILGYNPIIYKQVEQELSIDYIPPGKSIDELVFYMSTYPEAELSILSITSKEGTFVEDKIILSKYQHEEFEYLEDSIHLRKLLGL